jgi:hypothetical protein
VAGFCVYGDEPWSSGATKLVYLTTLFQHHYIVSNGSMISG